LVPTSKPPIRWITHSMDICSPSPPSKPPIRWITT